SSTYSLGRFPCRSASSLAPCRTYSSLNPILARFIFQPSVSTVFFSSFQRKIILAPVRSVPFTVWPSISSISRASGWKFWLINCIILYCAMVCVPFITSVFFIVAPFLTGGLVVFRSEEHTSELQSRFDLVCRLLL